MQSTRMVGRLCHQVRLCEDDDVCYAWILAAQYTNVIGRARRGERKGIQQSLELLFDQLPLSTKAEASIFITTSLLIM
jgi:hypothetical protein